MKRSFLKRNFWIRFAAFFFFFSAIIVFVLTTLGTLYAIDTGYFIDNGESDRKDIRSNYAHRYASQLMLEFCADNPDYSSFFVNIYYGSYALPLNTDNIDYVISKKSDNTIVASDLQNSISNYVQSEDTSITLSSWDNHPDNKEITEEFSITVYYPYSSAYQDSFTTAMRLSRILSDFTFPIAISAIISFLSVIALFIFLIQSAGISSDGTATPGFLGKVPIEIFAGIIALIEMLCIALSIQMVDNMYSGVPGIVLCIFCSLIMFLWLSMSLAARFRSRTFFKYCLTWIIIKLIGKFIRMIWRIYHKAGFLWRSAIILISVTFALLISVILTYAGEPLGLFFMYLLWATLAVLFSIACANLAKLRKAISRLASGDYTTKVSTFGMFFDFRRAAHNVNSIFDGMTNAVEERMKSERMKTELITNVSHDIKTPLTSIINCVDIMKNSGEEFSDQTKEYLDILSRQSLRLKKLTEDVLEASKASTGNIAVELAPIDMGLLLSQAMGEYSDKFEEKGIKTVVNIAEENIFALGDGRLLWRVFDNIFSNISRYSLSGTRAYIDVFKANGMVYATFKNVSSYELPIDSKELLERFVRADASRNSEGSGLGLSISEDLCSLMGGKLNISTEADLFKATVTLPVCSPVPHKPQNN